VSYRIGERLWRSSGQPTLLITFSKMLKHNNWRSNKHGAKGFHLRAGVWKRFG